MKRANTLATILIVFALIAGSIILVQQQIFPSTTQIFPRMMSDFSQFVFSENKEVVEAYALNGYSENDYWYCADRPSQPNITKVTQEFPEFASAFLSGELETLTTLFPQYNIEISRPLFGMYAPAYDNIVSINVSNFSVTFHDGDRLVSQQYNGEEDMALRFWFMYSVMSGWLSCNNADIFNSVDKVLETQSCAFYKDQCFCAADPDEYTLCEPGDIPGVDCNPCPCGQGGLEGGLPVYNDPLKGEDCSLNDPSRCQDFTYGERDFLLDEYGLSPENIWTIGETIVDNLNSVFAHNVSQYPLCAERLESVISQPSNIRCEAEVENVEVENHLFTSFIYHPSACGEQVDGTCGIIPLDQMNSLLCKGSEFCPINGDDSRSVIANRELRQTELQDLPSASENCELVTIEEPGNEPYEQWICYSNGRPIFVENGSFIDCRLSHTLFTANKGASGSYENDSLRQGLVCNPIPQGADGGPGDVATGMLGDITPGLHSIEDDWDRSQGNWYGTNGWLDRRASLDLKITCSDPGSQEGEYEPLQTAITMKIIFRHGCDQKQDQYRAWAPPGCGFAPETTNPGCPINCNSGNPCVRGRPICPENEEPYCEWDSLAGALCGTEIENNQCASPICVVNPDAGDDPTQAAICDRENLQNKPIHTACGACKQCNGEGACVAELADGYFCSVPNGGVCSTGVCSAGLCEEEPVDDGTPCGSGQCGECRCQSGQESWNYNQNDCPDPQAIHQCTNGLGPVIGQTTYTCQADGSCAPQQSANPIECCGATPLSQCGFCCSDGESASCVASQSACGE